MNAIVFQKIYDEIDKYLPDTWDKIVVYLEYMEGAYSFSFFVKQGREYVKCYDIPRLNEDALMQSFKNIDNIINKERKDSKECWTNMTMIVKADGDMHTDFDYTDLSEGSYKYKKEWKAKYLI